VLNQYGNAIIAVFTIVLAFTTILQWIVTAKATEAAITSANAAELNARAALGVELPVLRPDSPELQGIDADATLDGPYGSWDIQGPPEHHTAVSRIIMRNYGRTPAFPEYLEVGFTVAETLPDKPYYAQRGSAGLEAVIRPNDHVSLEIHFPIRLSDKQIAATKADEGALWFYCALGYSDFLNVTREARFCWRWQKDIWGAFYYFSSDCDPPAEYTKQT
jgi:hypothetical protein